MCGPAHKNLVSGSKPAARCVFFFRQQHQKVAERTSVDEILRMLAEEYAVQHHTIHFGRCSFGFPFRGGNCDQLRPDSEFRSTAADRCLCAGRQSAGQGRPGAEL